MFHTSNSYLFELKHFHFRAYNMSCELEVVKDTHNGVRCYHFLFHIPRELQIRRISDVWTMKHLFSCGGRFNCVNGFSNLSADLTTADIKVRDKLFQTFFYAEFIKILCRWLSHSPPTQAQGCYRDTYNCD